MDGYNVISTAVKWDQTKAGSAHRAYHNIHQQRTVMNYRYQRAT